MKRPSPALLIVGATFAGILFVFGYMLFQIAQPIAPPLHYTQLAYTPARAVYAPLESMVYTPTLEIKQAGRVDVLRSFWSVTTDSAASLCDGSSAPTTEIKRNLPPGAVGDIRGARAVRITIPNLPPGDYLLLSSATGPGGGQSVYQVSFTVIKKC